MAPSEYVRLVIGKHDMFKASQQTKSGVKLHQESMLRGR